MSCHHMTHTTHAFVRGLRLVPQDPNAKAGKFGFAVDNTIGATPQPNGWMDDWVEFYRERRIRHQLNLLGEIVAPRIHPHKAQHSVAAAVAFAVVVV